MLSARVNEYAMPCRFKFQTTSFSSLSLILEALDATDLCSLMVFCLEREMNEEKKKTVPLPPFLACLKKKKDHELARTSDHDLRWSLGLSNYTVLALILGTLLFYHFIKYFNLGHNKSFSRDNAFCIFSYLTTVYLQRGVTLYHLHTIEFVTHVLKQLKQHDVALGVTPLCIKWLKAFLYTASVCLCAH